MYFKCYEIYIVPASNDLNKKMQHIIILLTFLQLFLSNTYATEWDCTGASNTGTFQRSTGCTISGTTATNGGGVVVTNTLEIVGTVEDMNNLIVITAPSKQRHFYVNGVNDKLVLRYLKLIGGDISSYGWPGSAGGSICIYTSGGTLLLYSSIIANNQAGTGGGIFAFGDKSNIEKTNVIINKTSIIGNKATSSGYSGDGGGCYIGNSNGILVRTSISKNTASYGGGLFLYKASSTDTMTVQIRETTFTANKARDGGNEIYTHGRPTISIVNTLFNQPVDSNNNFFDSGAR